MFRPIKAGKVTIIDRVILAGGEGTGTRDYKRTTEEFDLTTMTWSLMPEEDWMPDMGFNLLFAVTREELIVARVQRINNSLFLSLSSR